MPISYAATPTPANGQARSAAALTATFNTIMNTYNGEVGTIQTTLGAATDSYSVAAQKNTLVKRNASTGGINVGVMGAGPLAADAGGFSIVTSSAPAGHAGNLFEGLLAGVSKFAVSPQGQVTATGLFLNTNPLNAASGGTGVASPTAHRVPISNGAAAMNFLAEGTANFVLTSNGPGIDPAWKAATGGGGPGSGIDPGTAIVTSGDYSSTYTASKRMQAMMSAGAGTDGDLYPYFKRNPNSASLADALRFNVSAGMVGAIAINPANVSAIQISASPGAPQFISFNNDMRVITTNIVTTVQGNGQAVASGGGNVGVWKLMADFSGTGPGFTVTLVGPLAAPTATQLLLANVYWDGTQLQMGMIDFSPILPQINSRNVRFDSFKQVSTQFDGGGGPGSNVTLSVAGAYSPIPSTSAVISTFYNSSAVNGFIWWRANVQQPATKRVVTIVPYEVSTTPFPLGDPVDARAVPVGDLLTVSGFLPVSFSSPGQKSIRLYAFTDALSPAAALNGIWMMGFFAG